MNIPLSARSPKRKSIELLMQVLYASIQVINGQLCNLKDDEIALIDDEQCVHYCFLL